MVFGKYVSEGLESDEPDQAISSLMIQLPAYDVPEKQLDVMWNGIPLTGRLDTFRIRDHAFREYKTGRRDKYGNPAWTQAKARIHGQIAFYGFMLWIQDKKIPPPAFLDWIVTEVKEDGTVALADHIESFEVPITITAIIDMGARIKELNTRN